jgi:signal transduction histidine kinase
MRLQDRGGGGKSGRAQLREIADVGGGQRERQQAMPPREISMLSSQSDFEVAGSFHRETVHDLRNLFAVIVAARRLLGKDRASERGEDLLAAIEDAAFRGSQLTTNLLARDAHEAVQTVDVAARLAGVAPLLLALADPWVEGRLGDQVARPACMKMAG